jgi:hypothetical protein
VYHIGKDVLGLDIDDVGLDRLHVLGLDFVACADESFFNQFNDAS